MGIQSSRDRGLGFGVPGFRVSGFRDRVAGFGVLGFQGSRFGVSGSVFRDSGLVCGVRGFRGSGLRVSSAGFGVWGSRLGVSGEGFRCSRFPIRCFEARDFGVGVSQLRVSGSWFLMFGVSD